MGSPQRRRDAEPKSGGIQASAPPSPSLRLCVSAVLSGSLVAASLLQSTALAADLTFFENKIRPLLADQCYSCHSVKAEKTKGGLHVDSLEALLTGGDSGPALVPGDAEKSLLIKAVRYTDADLQMPPKGKKLSERQIADLTRWIKAGAPWPEADKAAARPTKASHEITEQDRSWWAFQPIRRPQKSESVNSRSVISNRSGARPSTSRVVAGRTLNTDSLITDYSSIDSDNRYLWRANRRKLEAEAVRDSVLFVSGKLDTTMGGPSFKDFVIERPEHSPHYQYHLHDPEDPKSHRRSIYRFIVRSQQQPFMTVLDCADPSMQVGKRNESLSPLQALSLLNNSLMLTMSKDFAVKLEAGGGSVADKVRRGHLEALGRVPDRGDGKVLVEYAREHGLTNYCRLLLNLNEFSFVD